MQDYSDNGSRRVWRLPGMHQHYLLMESPWLETNELRLRHVPSTLILAEFESWLSSASTARIVCEICEAVSGYTLFNPLTLEATQERYHLASLLRRALDTGRLVALSPQVFDAGEAGHGARQKKAITPLPSHAVEQEKSWIEIELLTEDGSPVAGERYSIVCSDGSVRQGTLNKKGYARHDELPPGRCTVTFPELHAGDWKLC